MTLGCGMVDLVTTRGRYPGGLENPRTETLSAAVRDREAGNQSCPPHPLHTAFETDVAITLPESWARLVVSFLINGENGPIDADEASQCRLTLIKAHEALFVTNDGQ